MVTAKINISAHIIDNSDRNTVIYDRPKIRVLLGLLVVYPVYKIPQAAVFKLFDDLISVMEERIMKQKTIPLAPSSIALGKKR